MSVTYCLCLLFTLLLYVSVTLHVALLLPYPALLQASCVSVTYSQCVFCYLIPVYLCDLLSCSYYLLAVSKLFTPRDSVSCSRVSVLTTHSIFYLLSSSCCLLPVTVTYGTCIISAPYHCRVSIICSCLLVTYFLLFATCVCQLPYVYLSLTPCASLIHTISPCYLFPLFLPLVSVNYQMFFFLKIIY